MSLPFGGVPDRRQGARPGRGLARHRGVARLQGPRSPPTPAPPSSASSATAARCSSARPRPASSAASTSRSPSSTASPATRGSRPAPPAARRAAAPPAVAGGLVTIATGGDGGGSIRIPAGFNGLVGMKGTAGRIPRGPHTTIAPLTVVIGCLARSVRDVARWYDVCAGYDSRDPYSLPEDRGLGARPRHPRPRRPAGRHRSPTSAATPTVRPEVGDLVDEAGEQLARGRRAGDRRRRRRRPADARLRVGHGQPGRRSARSSATAGPTATTT